MADGAEVAWQEIRTLRAAPPGLAAGDVERRQVFAAALRQAQELGAAAGVSGYATKPLALFYAFSQGLRAVCAARVTDDAWRVHGHGAQVLPSTPILATTIKPNPSKPKPPGHQAPSRDALSALFAVMGVPALTETFTLGEVWLADPNTPALPEGTYSGLGPLRLHLPLYELAADHAERGLLELAVEGLGVESTDAEIAQALEAFPALAGGTSPRAELLPREANYYLTERAQVTYNQEARYLDHSAYPGGEWVRASPVLRWRLEAPGQNTHDAAFGRRAPVAMEGKVKVRVAFPALGGVEHVEWPAFSWLLLLGLSSLARYEPAPWTEAIDPDQSTMAVPLEQACDLASAWVPTILHVLLTTEPN